ncbi:MAG TPA: RecQ family ATP-dependent DNA helicase [Flavobacteriales bacterium]|nr:RecQ family ATP-dependent DNA helicase [Flavobacteriales bacterium]
MSSESRDSSQQTKVEQQPTHAALHTVLKKYWGYDAFRPMQEEVMCSVMNGDDTLALLPTGGGKSLCFQVPALAMGKLCLVVSPLIALMKDQVERLRSMGIAARAVTSDMHRIEIENALDSAAVGKLSFLYVSPERLLTDDLLGRLPRMPLGLIAVDEAHCISQWGYDFRPAYTRIQELRSRVPKVPVLALTASATAEVVSDIMKQLAFAKPNVLRGSFSRPELVLWVSRGEDKQGRLLRVMEKVKGTGIVYMRERRGTVRIAHFLKEHGIAAEAYHAGLTTKERDRIQHAWTSGALRCVVATNAFGMGIDKADVRCVVHMEAPPDLESYYQEAGRGGRDRQKAYAFLFVGPGDDQRAREKLALSFPELSDVRRCYQAFADMNAIALGSGLNESYPLQLRAIADRTQLPIGTVANAFKALELDGQVALSEGARTPSRVFMRADQRTVYAMRVNDKRHGAMLEALLRLYGGLFEEPSNIDEDRISGILQKPWSNVVEQLRELDRQGVISYKQRSDEPSVTLLLQRADAARLTLNPEALRNRQQRAQQRLDAMLNYASVQGRCRMVSLLSYFDEPSPTPCGQCDLCAARTRYTVPGSSTMAAEPLAHYHRDIDAERMDLDEHDGQA